MPDIKRTPENEKPKASTVWIDDPYPARSEDFYRAAYAGGKCKYCGKAIHSHTDCCACPGIIAAREKFKSDVRIKAGYISAPVKAAEPVKDNPDRNHTQALPDTFDIDQEERISPTIEDTEIPF